MLPGDARYVPDVLSLREFHDRVVQITSCDNCSEEERLSLEKARADLLSPNAYSANAGQDKLREIGHSPESMIADCRLIIMEGQFPRKAPCFPETDILYRFDANFFNCYILRLPLGRLPDFAIVGVSLVLHLDNFFMDHILYFDKTNTLSRTGGIKLSLHQPDTYPLIGFDGHFLTPGYFTDLRLRFVTRKRLGKPHGNCKDDSVGNVSYTTDYCLASCIQHHVMEVCGCIDFSTYADMKVYDHFSNLTSCLSLLHGRDNLLEMWECLLRERYHSTATCAPHCSLPCHEVAYSTKVIVGHLFH